MVRRLDQRSYEIQSRRATYRRNTQHLVKSPLAPTQLETAKASAPDPLPGPQPNPDAKFLNSPAANSQKGHPEVKPSKPTKQPTPVRTRSGRVIKEPVRFQDYGVT